MKRFTLFVVIVCHAALLFALLTIKEDEPTLPTLIAIQTVKLAPPPQAVAAPPKEPSAPKMTKVVTHAETTPSKKENKAPLIDKANAAIAKLGTSKPSVKTDVTATPPPLVKPLLDTKKINYQEELARRLSLMLTLPDYGDVRIKLFVSRDGKVNKLEVLSSSSEENQLYVLRTLPELKMPPFDELFRGDAEHAFTLTLGGR